MTTTTALDYEALAREFVHPLRLRILEEIAGGADAVAPLDLAARLGQPIGNVSYHVRQLESAGFITCVRTEPRRGAQKHFYEVAEKARP